MVSEKHARNLVQFGRNSNPILKLHFLSNFAKTGTVEKDVKAKAPKRDDNELSECRRCCSSRVRLEVKSRPCRRKKDPKRKKLVVRCKMCRTERISATLKALKEKPLPNISSESRHESQTKADEKEAIEASKTINDACSTSDSGKKKKKRKKKDLNAGLLIPKSLQQPQNTSTISKKAPKRFVGADNPKLLMMLKNLPDTDDSDSRSSKLKTFLERSWARRKEWRQKLTIIVVERLNCRIHTFGFEIARAFLIVDFKFTGSIFLSFRNTHVIHVHQNYVWPRLSVVFCQNPVCLLGLRGKIMSLPLLLQFLKQKI